MNDGELQLRNQQTVRLLSVNICISSPGGNLKYPAPLFLIIFTSIYTFLHTYLYYNYEFGLIINTVLAFVLCVLIAPQLGLTSCIPMTLLFPKYQEQYKRQRCDLLLEYMKDYDVVAIQECSNIWYSAYYEDYLVNGASKIGFKYHASGPRRPKLPATIANSGLLILSRLPIITHAHHIYRHQAWFDWYFVNRGALYARLQLEDGRIMHLAQTHLASGNEVLLQGVHVDNNKHQVIASDNSHGSKQIVEFVEFIKKNGLYSLTDSALRVVCGDFNCKPKRPEYEILSRLVNEGGLTDVFAEEWEPTFAAVDSNGVPYETLMTHWADLGKPKTLDYIFSSVPSVKRGVDRLAAKDSSLPYQQVSDHSGLYAHFVV